MGHLFRSEDMSCIQLFMETEVSHAVVTELGNLGVIEFRDLNEDVQSFKRNFMDMIRRCDEMERQIRVLVTNIKNSKIKIPDMMNNSNAGHSYHHVKELDEIADSLHHFESRIIELNYNEKTLHTNYLELSEMENVLRRAEQIFQQADIAAASTSQVGGYVSDDESDNDESAALLKGGSSLYRSSSLNGSGVSARLESGAFQLYHVSGVVLRSKTLVFERILWRILRGNMYFRSIEIPRPFELPDGTNIEKNVFFIYVQGQPALNKVRKICTSFDVNIYDCPQNQDEREKQLHQIVMQMSDTSQVLYKTTEAKRALLTEVAKHILGWVAVVRKQKAVNETLNRFKMDVTSKVLVAEGWCPTASLPAINRELLHVQNATGATIPTIVKVIEADEPPPTHFNTNKFTEPFQVIIEAYGVADYKEVNPAPFSIITFPFLFGIMFGDIGHGFIMFLIAAYICWKEAQLQRFASDEVFGMIFSGRYVLLLMGIFSMYAGLIYNDIFGKGLALFPSGWDFVDDGKGGQYGVYNYTYPLGIDPAWHTADNSLDFTNSFKMKLSIILGVLQMSFGIVLSAFNHNYFKHYVSVFHEFIPQMLFMQSIFGYLVFTIIYKWCIPWTSPDYDYGTPPSLLTMLIDMFLSPGKVDESEQLYEGQATVQTILLLVAVICIPWMLLVKPFWKKYQFNKQGAQVGDHSSDHINATFDFGETMIYQMIHTIEFCLGAISNTASYLRLWALSLAHQQLSIVLWNMSVGKTAQMGLSFGGVIGMFGATAMWIVLTMGILLGMEGLSAFLHALRLHWVEFDSKFYQANGRKFIPFSLQKVLEETPIVDP